MLIVKSILPWVTLLRQPDSALVISLESCCLRPPHNVRRASPGYVWGQSCTVKLVNQFEFVQRLKVCTSYLQRNNLHRIFARQLMPLDIHACQ